MFRRGVPQALSTIGSASIYQYEVHAKYVRRIYLCPHGTVSAAPSPSSPPIPTALTVISQNASINYQGFGHAVFCARHALLPASRTTATTSNSDIDSVAATNGNKHKKSAGCNGCTNGPDGSGGEGVGGSFLLVLGDHLYRRGAGTTQACANQLIHAFLEHGEAEKPAIGLKVMSCA